MRTWLGRRRDRLEAETARESAAPQPPQAAARAATGETQLRTSGSWDGLTGLGDLLGLKERLEWMVSVAPPSGPRPALLLLDLDGFGRIHQGYGGPVADRVLAVTGTRLKELVADYGYVFRTGGDEFAVLLDSTSPVEAVDSGAQILTTIREPIENEGSYISVTASAAVVMLGNRHRADGVLRDADTTMYRAKVEGGNRVDVYNWDLDDWTAARKKDVESLTREVEELRLQNQVLTEAMTVDPQTGMPNGLAFDADHSQLHARRSRSQEPYCILLVAVDHFDPVDGVRLPGGLRVLKTVGHTIRDTLRLSDRAYRSEESMFSALLQGTDLRKAVAAGERIRERVQKLALEHPADPSEHVTVTVGVIEAGFRHSNTKEVLAEVTDLLRDNKDSVKNRTIWPH
jgi:diguanylate cyclase (GGDEF)-like protein